jgi:hypothetical protein
MMGVDREEQGWSDLWFYEHRYVCFDSAKSALWIGMPPFESCLRAAIDNNGCTPESNMASGVNKCLCLAYVTHSSKIIRSAY